MGTVDMDSMESMGRTEKTDNTETAAAVLGSNTAAVLLALHLHHHAHEKKIHQDTHFALPI